jgi:hypothetical protein
MCCDMINLLLPDPPDKFAEFVMSHGTKLHNGSSTAIKMARDGREKGKMIPGKSFLLGAYPPNVVGEKHLL